jgi:TetR/AcrR family transcriptional repressor of nem operon
MSNTKIRALEEAKKLLQQVGYNGFSFQHIADALQIKKPSLYTHFKSKEDLGKCLIDELHSSFLAWTKIIEVFSPDSQIEALFETFCQFMTDSNRICLLSAMSADLNSLPDEMRSALEKEYAFRHKWIKNIIAKAQKQNIFRQDKSSEELTKLVLAAGLGAQICARVSGGATHIREIKCQILEVLTHKAGSSRGKRK